MLQSNSRFSIVEDGRGSGVTPKSFPLKCQIYLYDQSLAFKYDSNAEVVKFDQYDKNSKSLFEFLLEKA